MAPLPAEGSLEDRLRALQPASWQQDFCGQQQYGGKAAQQWQGAQQQHGQRPPGSPSLLLVSPSAIGAVNIIKLCPQFNRVGGWGWVGVGGCKMGYSVLVLLPLSCSACRRSSRANPATPPRPLPSTGLQARQAVCLYNNKAHKVTRKRPLPPPHTGLQGGQAVCQALQGGGAGGGAADTGGWVGSRWRCAARADLQQVAA